MCTVMKDFKQVHIHHFITLHNKKQEIERNVLQMITEYDYHVRLQEGIASVQEKVKAALQVMQCVMVMTVLNVEIVTTFIVTMRCIL